MHPTQFEEYKSGKAKEAFMADLKLRIEQKAQPATVTAEPQEERKPTSFIVEVDGEKFAVKVAYDDDDEPEVETPSNANGVPGAMIPITAPLEGKFFLTKETGEQGIKIGDEVHRGDTVAYIESMKVINAITSEEEGRVAEIVVTHGDSVEEDDVLIRLAPI